MTRDQFDALLVLVRRGLAMKRDLVVAAYSGGLIAQSQADARLAAFKAAEEVLIELRGNLYPDPEPEDPDAGKADDEAEAVA